MSKRILIVEDNDLNMKLFHDLLEAQGYATLQTKDGMEALKLARQHHPDLILMDIQLPEVSGLEMTKWIKEDDDLKTIPIIAITAFAMKGDEAKIREGGCDAYIAKPISATNFLRTVTKARARADQARRRYDRAPARPRAAPTCRPSRHSREGGGRPAPCRRRAGGSSRR
jgi:two-component system cell cycle response regulator DivK